MDKAEIAKNTYFDMFHPFRDNFEERKILVSWCKHFVDRGVRVRVTPDKNLSIPNLSKDGSTTTGGKCFRLWVNYLDHMKLAEACLAETEVPGESITDFINALKSDNGSMEFEEFEDLEAGEKWDDLLKRRISYSVEDDD